MFFKLNNLNLDKDFYLTILNNGIKPSDIPEKILDSIEFTLPQKLKFNIKIDSNHISSLSLAEKILYEVGSNEEIKSLVSILEEKYQNYVENSNSDPKFKNLVENEEHFVAPKRHT